MKLKSKILAGVAFVVVVGCAYCWHDWYWTVVSWVHPDVSRQYERQFQALSNAELLEIMEERTSPRTNGALWVLEKRENTDDVFDELYRKNYFGYMTSDRDRKVYNILFYHDINNSFTRGHARSMQILAKLGYEEMIPEAGKFAARGQYDEALEALKYLKSNTAARELIEQIAAQNNDLFAADRAKKMLVN